MGNTESITIGSTDDGESGKKRSRREIRKFNQMHTQKSNSISREEEESRIEVPVKMSKHVFELDQLGENCPKLTLNERQTIIATWGMVEAHIARVGLSSFLELFRRAPESLHAFPFLKHLNQEDLEFYAQLRNHSVRVTGVLSMLVRQVSLELLSAAAVFPEYSQGFSDYRRFCKF